MVTVMKRTRRAAVKLLCILTVLFSTVSFSPVKVHADDGQVPDKAWNLVKELNLGWNLGNSLEIQNIKEHGYIAKDSFGQPNFDIIETSLGNPVTTRELIAAVADRGFSSIRIPVSFYNHLKESQPSTDIGGGKYQANPGYTIDEEWLKRVKEVVDWSIDAGLYVIINVHHDTSMWMNLSWIYAQADDIDKQKEQLAMLWSQYAAFFKDYDNRLLFQATGEIVNKDRSFSSSDYLDFRSVHDLNQHFIDTVRSTGGNNTDRFLILPTYAANSGPLFVDESFYVPYEDDAEDKLIYSVHNYSTSTEDLQWYFEQLYKRAVKYDVPFIMDECGAQINESDETRIKVSYTLASLAEKYNSAVFVWDSGVAEHSYIDRAETISSKKIVYTDSYTYNGNTYETDSKSAVDALFKGKEEAESLSSDEINRLLDETVKYTEFKYLNAGNYDSKTEYGDYFVNKYYSDTNKDAAYPVTILGPAYPYFACINPYVTVASFKAILPDGVTVTIKEIDEDGKYIGQKYITSSEGTYVPSSAAKYMAVCFRCSDTSYDFDDYLDAVKNGSLELYPADGTVYVPSYTLRFQLNGGTYNGSSDDIIMSCEADSIIQIPAAPKKDGYRFLYWEGSRYSPGQEYKVVGDHVFTARWQKIESTDKKFSIPETGVECSKKY